MIVRLLLLIMFLVIPQVSFAASRAQDVKEGNRLYQEGKYKESVGRYRNALQKDEESDIVNFNLGTALYKNKEYDQAIDHFKRSLLTDDVNLRQKAQYNLGNALYRWGMTKGQKDLPGAIANLEESLYHYERALEINQEDEDAKFNYEFVKKELERLKKQLEQQSKQEQQQKQKSNEQNQEQKQQQQQQQQQEQNQQGQQQQQPPQSQQGEQPQEKKDESSQSDSQKEKPQSQGEKQQDQESSAGSGQEQKQEPSGESFMQGQSGGRTGKQMSPQEAKMLLENYQQGEEPKGLLNFNLFKGKSLEQDVEKDW